MRFAKSIFLLIVAMYCSLSLSADDGAHGVDLSQRQNRTFAAVLSELVSNFSCSKELNQEFTNSMKESKSLKSLEFYKQFATMLTSGRKPAPEFMSRTSAKIEIDNRVSSLCDARCETDVAWTTVAAVIVWRNFCIQCSEDFLTVISVGHQHWVDTRVMNWLNAPGTKSLETFPLKNLSVNLLANARITGIRPHGSEGGWRAPRDTKPSGVYYELLDNAQMEVAKKTICDAALSTGDRPSGLLALQDTLCNGAKQRSAAVESTMRIALLPGETGCGETDYIACARTNLNVELTMQGVRYSFLDFSGKKLISVGDKSVSKESSGTSVILHEVGHWFGLDHVADKSYPPLRFPDVMQEGYLDHPCLSVLSVSKSSIMDEERYQESLTKYVGLKYAAPKGAPIEYSIAAKLP